MLRMLIREKMRELEFKNALEQYGAVAHLFPSMKRRARQRQRHKRRSTKSGASLRAAECDDASRCMDIKTYGDSMTEALYKWSRAPFCELFGSQVFHFASHRLAMSRVVTGFAGAHAITRVDAYSDSQGHDNLILTVANIAISAVGAYLLEGYSRQMIRPSRWVRIAAAMGDNSAQKYERDLATAAQIVRETMTEACAAYGLQARPRESFFTFAGYKLKGVLYILGTSYALEGKVGAALHPGCLTSARTSTEYLSQIASAASAYYTHDGQIDQAIGSMYSCLLAYAPVLAPSILMPTNVAQCFKATMSTMRTGTTPCSLKWDRHQRLWKQQSYLTRMVRSRVREAKSRRRSGVRAGFVQRNPDMGLISTQPMAQG